MGDVIRVDFSRKPASHQHAGRDEIEKALRNQIRDTLAKTGFHNKTSEELEALIVKSTMDCIALLDEHLVFTLSTVSVDASLGVEAAVQSVGDQLVAEFSRCIQTIADQARASVCAAAASACTAMAYADQLG